MNPSSRGQGSGIRGQEFSDWKLIVHGILHHSGPNEQLSPNCRTVPSGDSNRNANYFPADDCNRPFPALYGNCRLSKSTQALTVIENSVNNETPKLARRSCDFFNSHSHRGRNDGTELLRSASKLFGLVLSRKTCNPRTINEMGPIK